MLCLACAPLAAFRAGLCRCRGAEERCAAPRSLAVGYSLLTHARRGGAGHNAGAVLVSVVEPSLGEKCITALKASPEDHKERKREEAARVNGLPSAAAETNAAAAALPLPLCSAS